MTEEVTVADPQERFQDFLKSDKYRRRISQMSLAGSTSLIVEFEEFLATDSALAESIIEKPDEYLEHANRAAYAQLQIEDPEYAERIAEIGVKARFRGLPEATPLRALGSDHIGKLVMVDGIIVRATPSRPMVTHGAFRCKRCGTINYVDQTGPFLNAPVKCSDPACGRAGLFDFIQEESTFIDSQEIRIQERPEDLPPGQLPRWINIKLIGRDLVDIARPGDHVSIVGVVRAEAPTLPRVGKLRVFTLNLDANFIDITSKEPEAVLISPEEEKQILELAMDPWVHRKVVRSIAPSIYGYEHIKEAIMYQLFGGVPKHLPDITIRGDMNILMIGDPGTAKCIGGNSLIVLADGTITEIEKMVHSTMDQGQIKTLDDGYYVETNHKLLSLNTDGTVTEGVSSIFWKREAPENLYEVTTRTGRTITVTPTHPFFTIRDGVIMPVEAQSLKIHDFIATPRTLKVKVKTQKLQIDIKRGRTSAKHVRIPDKTTPELCRIIGYLLGDGYCCITTTYQTVFTNKNSILRTDFSNCVKRVFGISPYTPPSHEGKDLWISSVEIGRFFEKLIPGIFLGAAKKEISEIITGCSNLEIANLLRALFDSDATVSIKGREISLVSTSNKLLRQVQLLLLRFRILSQLGETLVNGKSYARLRISGENVILYAESIGFLHPRKAQRLKEHVDSGKKFNTNLDVIPNTESLIKQVRCGLRLHQSECGVPRTTFTNYERGRRNPSLRALQKIVASFTTRLEKIRGIKEKIESIEGWNQILNVRRKLRVSQRELASFMGVNQGLISQYELGKLRTSNEKLLRGAKEALKEVCNDILSNQKITEKIACLQALVRADIFWDRVSSIKGFKPEEKWVYDLQVNGTHNFIANGLFVHNSQLLQYVARIAPRGLYTSGRGTTAAGLTAAVIREREGGMSLEAGALVLADKGIACIDEIDKMRPEDRVAIHEAMEQHTISVAKGGIVATLNARTALLAAANPALGRYEPYRTVAENIALPITILSRFDLIFVLRDVPEKELDAKMSEHILDLHKTGMVPVEPPIPPDLLRKYVSYAKNIKPVLTEEALHRLRDFYLTMRSASETEGTPIAITARQLESLVRLAESRARVAFRKEILAEDAEAAIAIMKRSLEEVGIDVSTHKLDIDIIMTGKPKSVRDKLQVIIGSIVEMERETGMVEKSALLEKLEAEHEIKGPEAERLMGQLMKEGTIYSPREGFLKKT
ncbi:MAG: Minichromosome maintenance protein MCM [Candidatus Bathyarchaeota archaeon BA1]|nr:MAG: Minichromosome maintenance protein MCM [Candidatus Bathyarchaeota archaeon BA1]